MFSALLLTDFKLKVLQLIRLIIFIVAPCILKIRYILHTNKCTNRILYIYFFPGTTQPIVGVYFTALYRALASLHMRLHDHTQRATVGRTPLNE
jgi:hypothetical protein